MVLKLTIFFSLVLSLHSNARTYCENNFRYEYVWDTKRMFCSARLNLKHKLAMQLTPEGMEIINKKSANSIPYNVSRAYSRETDDARLELYSNGGVFLQTLDAKGTKSEKKRKVNFSESSPTREKIKFIEHAYNDTAEALTEKDQLIDINKEDQSDNDQDKKISYDVTRKLISCPNDPKDVTRNRFIIEKVNRKVKYAIDPDFYFKQSFHKITNASECENKNYKDSKRKPTPSKHFVPSPAINVTK